MPDKVKCTVCGNPVSLRYEPMDEWGIKGPLCGKCYSQKISEHYPGKHVRVSLYEKKEV
ncbi:hypothetical protein [Nitrosopumilus sp. b1]|uniref:hypothetical protein n=1 Tax=Nitrosopumilus sp. b1 TaxID=2109907 RepID=UPI0015F69AD2|nr:hypothetical protein [Nitrosopumilus sp. b1]